MRCGRDRDHGSGDREAQDLVRTGGSGGVRGTGRIEGVGGQNGGGAGNQHVGVLDPAFAFHFLVGQSDVGGTRCRGECGAGQHRVERNGDRRRGGGTGGGESHRRGGRQ